MPGTLCVLHHTLCHLLHYIHYLYVLADNGHVGIVASPILQAYITIFLQDPASVDPGSSLINASVHQFGYRFVCVSESASLVQHAGQ